MIEFLRKFENRGIKIARANSILNTKSINLEFTLTLISLDDTFFHWTAHIISHPLGNRDPFLRPASRHARHPAHRLTKNYVTFPLQLSLKGKRREIKVQYKPCWL